MHFRVFPNMLSMSQKLGDFFTAHWTGTVHLTYNARSLKAHRMILRELQDMQPGTRTPKKSAKYEILIIHVTSSGRIFYFSFYCILLYLSIFFFFLLSPSPPLSILHPISISIAIWIFLAISIFHPSLSPSIVFSLYWASGEWPSHIVTYDIKVKIFVAAR